MTNKDMLMKVREYIKKKLNREEYCTVNVEIISSSTGIIKSQFNIYYNGGDYYSGNTFNQAFENLEESFNKDKKPQVVEIEE